MKTTSSNLLTHLTGEVSTLALCWKIIPVGLTPIGFTSHTSDLVISGVTYLSTQGFTPTTIQTTSSMSVDNLNVSGLLDALGIQESDVRSGAYDGASVEVLLANWSDLTQGVMKLRRGFMGNVSMSRLGFEAEVRGLLERYQRTLMEIYGPACRADLGDARCGVRLTPPAAWAATTAYTARTNNDAKTGSIVQPSTPNGFWYHCSVAGTSGGSEPTWSTTLGATTTDGSVTWVTIYAMTLTGTVTAVTSKRVFADSARAEATDHFLGGLLTWTSGNNTGKSMEVKTFDGTTKYFDLMLPMFQTIQIGDTFSVYIGCTKDKDTCRDKFGNIHNYRGEPFVPQTAAVAVSAPMGPVTVDTIVGAK